MTTWTLAGAGAVISTLILAAMGMVLAIRQTQSLARLRIDDLRPEARLVRENILNQVMPQLEDLLERMADTLRTRHDTFPFAGTQPPVWVDEAYLFDSDLSVAGWSRQASGEWRRWTEGTAPSKRAVLRGTAIMVRLVPPLIATELGLAPEPVQFAHDVVEGEPFVMAHRIDMQGLHGPTIVGVRIDLPTLADEVIRPKLPDDRLEVKLTVASEDESEPPAVPWSEDFEPVAPFLKLYPTQGFIQGQFSVVRRQTVIFIVVTALAVGALMLVVWGMWRILKREIALSRLKQAFVADVSHELKTPLSLIRLFGETLLSGRVPTEEKKREYYEIITRESNRLTHLINNILDFARIDAGRKQYAFEPTSIAALVRETYEAYQLQLDHDDFEHQLIIEDDLPEVYCDANAIAQALINLINNAMKYTDKDDRFLGIDVSAETRRGRHGVLLSVSDRGIGIKPEDRAQLFSGFYRANDERVRKQRGAGLGLALVKHIVDAHDGIVDVESRLVKGSTFRIFLPVNQDKAHVEDQNNAQNPDR